MKMKGKSHPKKRGKNPKSKPLHPVGNISWTKTSRTYLNSGVLKWFNALTGMSNENVHITLNGFTYGYGLTGFTGIVANIISYVWKMYDGAGKKKTNFNLA